MTSETLAQPILPPETRDHDESGGRRAQNEPRLAAESISKKLAANDEVTTAGRAPLNTWREDQDEDRGREGRLG
jgi:hypothetical protein